MLNPVPKVLISLLLRRPSCNSCLSQQPDFGRKKSQKFPLGFHALRPRQCALCTNLSKRCKHHFEYPLLKLPFFSPCIVLFFTFFALSPPLLSPRCQGAALGPPRWPTQVLDQRRAHQGAAERLEQEDDHQPGTTFIEDRKSV